MRFSLDVGSGFWEALDYQITEFPGFVPDRTARPWRALLFLGFAFSVLVRRDAATAPR